MSDGRPSAPLECSLPLHRVGLDRIEAGNADRPRENPQDVDVPRSPPVPAKD